jgi:hypothetical protein
MTTMLDRRAVLAAIAASALPLQARAQAFPSRTITIVVPYPPGGPIDSLARLIAQETSADLKQPVVVENRPGAGGALGTGAVARAEPDGYTVRANLARQGLPVAVKTPAEMSAMLPGEVAKWAVVVKTANVTVD